MLVLKAHRELKEHQYKALKEPKALLVRKELKECRAHLVILVLKEVKAQLEAKVPKVRRALRVRKEL